MKEVLTYIQMAVASVGGFIGAFLGGLDGFIYALAIMVLLDYLLGVVIAVVQKKLSSSVGFRGIAKKVLIFAFVGIGATIDTYIIGSGSAIRTAVIFFYLANEGISILENAAALGLPVPPKLRDVLAQLNDGDKTLSPTRKEDPKHDGTEGD